MKARLPAVARPSAGRAQTLAPLLLATLVITLTYAARHGLVEPPELTARCDAAPWQGIECILRTVTVQAFVGQRVGIAAFALALLATVTRWRLAALGALAAGSAGLLLYSLTWAAPAVLLAVLVLVRPCPRGSTRERGIAP